MSMALARAPEPEEDEEEEDQVHVASMDLWAETGKKIVMSATVFVADQNGGPVAKARVRVRWYVNGEPRKTTSARSSARGQASFKYRGKGIASGDVVKMTVVGVRASGHNYGPGSNARASAEIRVP